MYKGEEVVVIFGTVTAIEMMHKLDNSNMVYPANALSTALLVAQPGP